MSDTTKSARPNCSSCKSIAVAEVGGEPKCGGCAAGYAQGSNEWAMLGRKDLGEIDHVRGAELPWEIAPCCGTCLYATPVGGSDGARLWCVRFPPQAVSTHPGAEEAWVSGHPVTLLGGMCGEWRRKPMMLSMATPFERAFRV